MIVLDASAAVEWLLGLRRAGAVESRIVDAGTVHAPQLLPVEVAHVVRRLVIAEGLDPERGAEALDDLVDLGVATHPHEPLLGLIWGMRANLTAYDAAYVAVAAAIGAPLVTLDARLAAAPDTGVEIDLVD
ncbi:MAG: type II toxin-antitoxin system VapC family toxin [Actinomycetota bacterium]